MAETPKFPTITEIPEEPTTGAGSLAPASEIPQEPEIQEPEPVTEPVVEPVAEIVEEPVTPEPVEPEPAEVVEPVVVEPTVETTVEPVIETPTPVVAEEPTKTADTKVETVQDIKAKETSNEAQENELNETKKNQVVSEMQKMIQNGSTLEEIAAYGTKNIQFKDDINTVLRGSFKNLANAKYFGKYSTLNNEDMYAAYQSGLVVPGSEQYNLLPPEKKSSFDAYLKEQEASNLSSKTDFTASEKVTDLTYLESQISKMYSSTARENYNKTLNSEQFITLSNQITEKKIELEKMDIEMEDLQEDLEKELAGTGLAASVRAKSTQAYKTAVKDKRLALAEYNAYVGQYQTLKSNAETELEIAMYEDSIAREQYQTELSIYESRRQERLSAEASALGRQQDLEDRELLRQQELEDRAFEIKNNEIATQKSFENNKILAKYKNDLEQGNIKGQWQDRFDGLYFLNSDGIAEKVIDGGYETNSDGTSTYTSIGKDGKPIVQVYDIAGNPIGASTVETSFTQDQVDMLNAGQGEVIPTTLSEVSKNNHNRGAECGEYINRIFGSELGAKMGNSYSSKLAIATEKSGGLGSIVVWQPNASSDYYSQFGHAGVIVGESEDGKSWHVKSSNFKGDGTISVDEVPKSVIDGYKTTSLYNKPIEEKTYTEAQDKFLSSIDLEEYGKNDNVKETAESLGLTDAEVYGYKAQNVPTETINQIETLLTRLNNLKGEDGKFDSKKGFSRTIGATLLPGNTFIPGSGGADYKADLETFLANITINNLDKMSGVLTDKDIEVLKSAGTSISTNISEKQFIKRMSELEEVYKKALGKNIGEKFFTDSTGKKWTKDGIADEISKLIDNGTWTAEQGADFIKRNNLKFN